MKKFILISITLSILYSSCITSKKIVLPNNYKINYSLKNVMIFNDSIIRDTFDIYITYQDQYKIFELPYHETNEVNNSLIYDSLKYEYFIFDTSKNYGYSIMLPNDNIGLHINKDSILLNRGGSWGDASRITEVGVITGTSREKLNNEIIDKYYIKDTIVDSSYYYYSSNMKDIKLSLSNILDSTNNSKLYKIIIFYNKKIFIKSMEIVPFYGLEIEIKKTPLTNIAEIQLLINKIENAENNTPISKKPPG